MNIAILFTVFLSVLHVFGMMQSNNLGMLGRDGDAAVDSTDTENGAIKRYNHTFVKPWVKVIIQRHKYLLTLARMCLRSRTRGWMTSDEKLMSKVLREKNGVPPHVTVIPALFSFTVPAECHLEFVPTREPLRDPVDIMMESSRCPVVINSDDQDGLYGMIEKCWQELLPHMPPKPLRINMAVRIIVEGNPSIRRPENIRRGDSIKFFYPCPRCFN